MNEAYTLMAEAVASTMAEAVASTTDAVASMAEALVSRAEMPASMTESHDPVWVLFPTGNKCQNNFSCMFYLPTPPPLLEKRRGVWHCILFQVLHCCLILFIL